jgi:V/A-type H+-transporting ATPase subunit C
MTRAERYAELAAAVRSLKGELIQPPQLERFLESGSLAEIVSAITGGRITSADPFDLSTVESLLVQRSIELAQRLAFYAPQDSRPLVKHFSRGFEYTCVKEILKASSDQVDPEEALRHIVPAGKFTADRCKDLIESHNPNRVIESVDDEALRRFVAPKLTGERGSFQAVSAIDQYYFMRLWAASNLRDLVDAQSAKGLIGEAIDHLNILLALRARQMGLDARTASEIMIPINYSLGQAFNELPEANNVQNLERILEKTRYANSFEAGTTLEGGRVECELNRSHAKDCLNMFAGSPFNVGLALAFLFLKNYELRDLFSLVNAKANNLPSERVLEFLILRTS